MSESEIHWDELPYEMWKKIMSCGLCIDDIFNLLYSSKRLYTSWTTGKIQLGEELFKDGIDYFALVKKKFFKEIISEQPILQTYQPEDTEHNIPLLFSDILAYIRALHPERNRSDSYFCTMETSIRERIRLFTTSCLACFFRSAFKLNYLDKKILEVRTALKELSKQQINSTSCKYQIELIDLKEEETNWILYKMILKEFILGGVKLKYAIISNRHETESAITQYELNSLEGLVKSMQIYKFEKFVWNEYKYPCYKLFKKMNLDVWINEEIKKAHCGIILPNDNAIPLFIPQNTIFNLELDTITTIRNINGADLPDIENWKINKRSHNIQKLRSKLSDDGLRLVDLVAEVGNISNTFDMENVFCMEEILRKSIYCYMFGPIPSTAFFEFDEYDHGKILDTFKDDQSWNQWIAVCKTVKEFLKCHELTNGMDSMHSRWFYGMYPREDADYHVERARNSDVFQKYKVSSHLFWRNMRFRE